MKIKGYQRARHEIKQYIDAGYFNAPYDLLLILTDTTVVATPYTGSLQVRGHDIITQAYASKLISNLQYRKSLSTQSLYRRDIQVNATQVLDYFLDQALKSRQ